MAKVYISGHRNPDMDSVAAAYALADYKNRTDKGNEYIPVVLGPLNQMAKGLFSSLGIEPPMLMRDVYAKVGRVMRKPTLVLSPEDPIYELVYMYNQSNPSVVPIMDGGKFKGLLSIDEINRYFLRENRHGRPLYNFYLPNIPRTVHGFFIKQGGKERFSAPLMVGAMRYDVFKRRLADCPVKPLLLVGCRKDHIREAIKAQLPGIILCGVEEDSLNDVDFEGFEGFVYASAEDTAETLRLLRLSVPVSDIVTDGDYPEITTDMLFDTAKGILAESNRRGIPVLDPKTGAFRGFITRRCFLNKPRTKVILVDHNEVGQSIMGLEDGEIVEIVDHHRLDAPKTKNPIMVISQPVGSTCTIVHSFYERSGLEISPTIAKILLSGIVSDTVILKSPTTTDADREACNKLLAIAGTDVESFSAKLFSQGAVLKGMDAMKVINSDFKTYNEGGVSFGIGQVEVTSLDDVDEVKEQYVSALQEVRDKDNLDWTMLLVTNVLSENSILFSTGHKLDYRIIYEKIGDGVYSLPGVLSRKKQLLPEILRVLE